MSSDWIYKPIGEVCKTGAGGTPLKSNKDFYEGGTVPWLLSGEVSKKDITEATNFITEKGLNGSSAKVFPKNTVLVAMYGATAGQTGILRIEAATNQAVCGIYPNDKFIPEFLYYTILAKNDELISQAAGNAQPNISQVKIKNTLVPVLPLGEQQRIVAILDEAFAGIATATVNAEKNLQNARELFDSTLQSVFAEKGEGWVSRKLGELTEVQSGGTPLRSISDYWDGAIPWYSSGELNDLYTVESERKITEDGLTGSNAKLFPAGSLLIGMYDTAALKMSILDRHAAFNQAIAGVKPNEEIDLVFVRHAINANKENILNLRRGVRQKNLSLGKIKDIVIPIPDIKEQRKVVTDLATIKAEVDRLEDIYRKKQDALQELKQSILQKAFAGELH